MDSTVTENNELEYFKPYSQDDSCDLNPEFAVICSFIADFGDKIDLELNIEQLQSSIENQTRLDNRLIDLHVKLLKKLRRYFIRDQWERALIRFASEYSYEDAYEIEQLGYLKTRPSIKLQLLRRLLDAQFECDQKFKGAVNLVEANDLRKPPLGRDIKGNTYWQRSDNEGNFRIFLEQPMDYKSWRTICSKPEELKYLIDELESTKDDRIKGEPMADPYNPLPDIFPELFKIEEEQDIKQEPIETKKAFKGRRGRKGGRGKKSSPLETVEEEDVATTINDNHVKDEDKKPDLNGIKEEPTSPTCLNITPDTSIESQVRATLENLIVKVVASFEFIKKPLSRLSSSPIDEEPQPAKKNRKRQPKREKQVEEVLPRRTSSRIQQITLKKIAEEEEKMKKMIESASHKKGSEANEPDDKIGVKSANPRNNHDRQESPKAGTKPGRKRKKGSKSWRGNKGKRKLSWDKDDSDLSSTSSETQLSDEDEDDLDEVEPLNFSNSNDDDEFACEDEEANNEPVIIKRARTARQSILADGEEDLNTSSIIEEDKPCGRCDKSNDPEWILLCDVCDDGYHTNCCVPPLMIVPDGDWFCPPCEHKTLLSKLRELYASIIQILESRERERIKRQRFRQTKSAVEPVMLEVSSALPEKRSRDILNELNEPVALQALDDELDQTSDESASSAGGKRKVKARKYKNARGKKVHKKGPSYEEDEEGFRVNYKKTRRTYSRKTDYEDSDESESETPEESESSEDEPQPKTRRARASVSYRFQEYDELIQSAIQAESAGEESEDSEDTSKRPFQSRGKDMATIEALAYQQENGMDHQSPLQVSTEQPSAKPRKKGRRLNDLDADTENDGATSDESFQASSATELEEEDEDDYVSELDSETSIDEILDYKKFNPRGKKRKKRRSSYESDDSDFRPKTSRRAATKQVSYRESSDEDESDYVEAPRKSKKNVLHSDDESDASWNSPAEVSAEEQSTSCEETQDAIAPTDDNRVTEDGPIETSEKTGELERSSEDLTELGCKKIRLERRETKAIVSLNKSTDGITYPPSQEFFKATMAPIPVASESNPRNSTILHTTETRDPMQSLDQYCSEKSHPTTMFNSYNEILTREQPSTPQHPRFYDDDDLTT